MTQPQKAAIVIGALGGGGANRVMMHLAGLLARNGLDVELVVPSPQPEEGKASLDRAVNLVELKAGHYYGALRLLNKFFQTKNVLLLPWACVTFVWKLSASLWDLRRYIRRAKPQVLLTAHYNSIAILANALAGRPSRVIVTEHTLLSEHYRWQPWPIRLCFARMCRLCYPRADRVVGVSRAVMLDLIEHFSVPPSRARFIYNPVTGPELKAKLGARCHHPWFEKREAPVIASVARLSPEKDFITLLEALALLQRKTPLRLIVLGDGPDREKLSAKARELGVDADVDWLGMVKNPLPYIREADAMVLPTLYEGLPTVLIESLLAGTTPVATDAPGGIREVLDGGRYGYLAPVRDPEALASAIKSALDTPIPAELLRERAEFFSDEKSLHAYLGLINENMLQLGQISHEKSGCVMGENEAIIEQSRAEQSRAEQSRAEPRLVLFRVAEEESFFVLFSGRANFSALPPRRVFFALSHRAEEPQAA